MGGVGGVDLVDEEVLPFGFDPAGGLVGCAPLVEEDHVPVRVAGDLPSLAVDEAVVPPAQGDEVVEVENAYGVLWQFAKQTA